MLNWTGLKLCSAALKSFLLNFFFWKVCSFNLNWNHNHSVRPWNHAYSTLHHKLIELGLKPWLVNLFLNCVSSCALNYCSVNVIWNYAFWTGLKLQSTYPPDSGTMVFEMVWNHTHYAFLSRTILSNVISDCAKINSVRSYSYWYGQKSFLINFIWNLAYSTLTIDVWVLPISRDV